MFFQAIATIFVWDLIFVSKSASLYIAAFFPVSSAGWIKLESGKLVVPVCFCINRPSVTEYLASCCSDEC